MNKTALALTIMALLSTTAKANIETFDTAATAAASGFILDPWIMYIDPGRPYLDNISLSHTITYSQGTFTFLSMEFNVYPEKTANYYTQNPFVNMILKGLDGTTILNTNVTLNPDGSWVSYRNNIANVHTIYFSPLANAYPTWPSVDNLNYSTGNSNPVPEPGTFYLFSAGIIAAYTVRAVKKRKLAAITK